MKWLKHLFERWAPITTVAARPGSPISNAATEPSLSTTSANGTIAGVRLIIQSEELSLAGGGALMPPASLFPSVDEELARSGRTRPGEFEAFVEEGGLEEPVLKRRLTDSQLRSACAGFFPRNDWACCTRMTQMTTYNVVIAFNVGTPTRQSEPPSTSTAPRERIEPFDTLIDCLRSDDLNEASADMNNALRLVKWPSTHAFVTGMVEELERIKALGRHKMSPKTNRAWQESLERIKNL